MLTNRWFCAAVERVFFFFLENISPFVYSISVVVFSGASNEDTEEVGGIKFAELSAKVSALVGSRGSKTATCSLDNVKDDI